MYLKRKKYIKEGFNSAPISQHKISQSEINSIYLSNVSNIVDEYYLRSLLKLLIYISMHKLINDL